MRRLVLLVMLAVVGCSNTPAPGLTPIPTVPTQIRTERVGQTLWQYQQPTFSTFRPLGFVGPDGLIYVVHEGVVEVLSDRGQRLRSFAYKTPGLDINDMTAAPDGTFWVVAPFNVGDEQVFQLDANGQLLGGFGHERLVRPTQIRVGADTNLYITNSPPSAINNYVTVFDSRGNLLREFDFGVEPRLTDYIWLDMDGLGQLAVTQYRAPFNETGVWLFDDQGQALARHLGAADIRILGVRGLAASPDGQMFYVAFGFEVYGIRRDGRVVGRYGTFQSRQIEFQEGRFYDITAIDVLPNGDVVMVDANENFYQVVRARFS